MLSKADLTQGSITGTLLRFTLPMIIGLYADGFPHFHPAGIVHGKRYSFFPAIWRRTDEGFTTKHLRIGRTHRNSDNRTEHSSSVFHSSHSQTITDSR